MSAQPGAARSEVRKSRPRHSSPPTPRRSPRRWLPEILLHLAEESLPIWQKTEEELGEMNVPPPYWAFAWAGGQALARYMLDNPQLLAGKRVLDLGSGSGLTAIAAMQGRRRQRARRRHRPHGARRHPPQRRAERRRGGDDGETISSPSRPSRYDVVLVGDLFYERALADLVSRFIDAAAAQGALVLIGDPQRNYFPKGRFAAAAEYRVPVTRELEDAEIKRTAVWRLGLSSHDAAAPIC